jgi:tricorn protease
MTFTPGVQEFDPHIAPDGRQIVYIRREGFVDAPFSTIWVMDSNGGNQRQLLAQPETNYERPVWSPDGRYLAYSATVSRRFSQIFRYDTLTGEVDQLTANPFNSRFPGWLPAGDGLIYNSFTPVPGSPDESTQALFYLDLETLESSLLFDDSRTIETHPAVSPDGTQVAYTSVRVVAERIIREIFVLALDTLETRQLTANGNDQFPRWHPDGDTIYFESFLTTIWAIDANGTNLRRITAEGESGYSRPDAGFLEAFLPLEP